MFVVQAASSKKTQILSATNAACNIYSNVTYLVPYWPQLTPEEGVSGENVSRPSTGLQKVKNSQAFPLELTIFFSEHAGVYDSKACL